MSVEESQRQFPRWETTFALAYVLGVVMVWSASSVSAAERIQATALLLALAGWWCTFGRRLVLTGDDTSWRGVAYLLGVLVLFASSVALVPECAWVLFGLCAQPYMVRPHRTAIAWVGALNTVPPLVILFGPNTSGLFWVQLAIAAGATAFSHIIGSSIERIAAQSQERAELICELEASRAQVAALSREAGVTAERERLARRSMTRWAKGSRAS